MSPSPPQEPLDIRAKSLTPQSPKPRLFPSPSNIPILKHQMDADIQITLPAAGLAPTTPPAVNQVVNQGLANSAPIGPDLDIMSPDNDTMHPHVFAEAMRHHSASEGGTHASLDSAQLAYLSAAINGDSSSHNALSNASEDHDAPTSHSHFPNAHHLDNAEPIAKSVPNASKSTTLLNDEDAFEEPTGVNIQALLESFSPTLSTLPTSLPSSSESTIDHISIAPAATTALPPRPPPQEKPSTHPNYNPGDDIRSYHPHGQTSSITAHLTQDAPSSQILSPAPNAATQLNAPFLYPVNSSVSSTSPADDEDGPFTPDLEREFDQFIRDERANVAEGNWDKFPDGSRLFIGNLPTEKVSKRDVFRRFRKYGKLGQISLKQAYGFVQFLDVDSCTKARDTEQDRPLKGRKMHLEISRPQSKGNRDRNGRRRSRSPDRDRIRNDRYTGAAGSPRERDNIRRGRDDYRPGRSPSPRGHRRGRSPDHYDGRRRTRSRSPVNRARYRDHRRDSDDDDIPLPRRRPQDVPDVQILVVDDLDRQFIAYIENTFKDRGVRCDVLILSPRLSEPAVVRRQILEGVLAVVRLTRASMATGKLSMQLFNHSGGAGNVNFEQYEGLDPPITAELVLRARKTHLSATSTAYAGASYGIPANYGISQPTSQTQAPLSGDLSNILSQLGPRPDLQGLIANLQSQLPAGTGATATLTPDIARYLTGQNTQLLQGYSQPSQPSVDLASILASHSSNPATQQAALAGSQQSSGSNGTAQQPDMQQIMAQLARYQR